ncbi:type IV toxin-antitoxin system AbiEi family antitoxin domain-containing protein [Nocardioides alkalitolerans]|uniref:type IV toxin-antitoxin system AbiEi family antitoxin domain-containing protein n=1 Tax=Nocardioides alkalitolerans TaxID=281714 RepID=UPI0004226E4A|nr:type IV toxin-antitoxin system AbiEi family antitoxin domain-containing protein [Nocardioides alkalitolerans]
MTTKELPDDVAALLHRQRDVVSRRQLVEAGLKPHEIRRLLRGPLTLVHPGVYAAQTGALTWRQRAWAAVLHAWPAALQGESAARACEGRADVERVDDDVVHVMIGLHRTLDVPPGVRHHRRARLEAQTQSNASPPRQRYPDALLDLALAAPGTSTRVAALARGLQRRKVSGEQLRKALAARARVADRARVAALLDDLVDGACGVLEHGYLDLVERPHGLPPSDRQVRAVTSQGVVYRDGEYDGFVVELDGRAFHDTASRRDADMERDLDAAVAGKDTRRLTYGQVFDRSCTTAAKLAALLHRHGWAGEVRSCGPTCTAAVGVLAA